MNDTKPIKKAILVFNCDLAQGVYVSFNRDANVYQLAKVTRKVGGIKKLSQELFERSRQAKTFIVLVRNSGTGEPPRVVRTAAASPLWTVPDFQRRESDAARTLATMMAEVTGVTTPTAFNAKLATMTEAQALDHVPSVSEEKDGWTEPSAEDAYKIRYPSFLLLKRNKSFFDLISRTQTEMLPPKREDEFLSLAGPQPEIEWVAANKLWDVLMVRDFIRANGRIFKIARKFGKVLEEADVDVSLSHIPFPLDIWIEFPDDLEFPIGNGDSVTSLLVHSREHFVGFVSLDADGLGLRYSLFDRRRNRTVGDLKMARGDGLAHLSECLQYALKCAIYVNSGDPDLRDRRPDRPNRHAKDIKKQVRSGNRPITMPITLVGFDYKKSRLYNMAETSVKGHFRWQPYGPGRTNVKLIFVADHRRTFRMRKSAESEVAAMTADKDLPLE